MSKDLLLVIIVYTKLSGNECVIIHVDNSFVIMFYFNIIYEQKSYTLPFEKWVIHRSNIK